jgi:hypothetical protein
MEARRAMKLGRSTNRKVEESNSDGRGEVVRKRDCGISGTCRRTEIRGKFGKSSNDLTSLNNHRTWHRAELSI